MCRGSKTYLALVCSENFIRKHAREVEPGSCCIAGKISPSARDLGKVLAIAVCGHNTLSTI